MKQLNILQINSSKTWAGGETHIKDLIKGLLEREHNIFLAVRSQIVDKFKNMDIDLKVLPLKNSIDLYSIWKLTKIIKENKIDIIHVHNGKDYWLAVIARFFAGRAKIVATRHILKPLGNSFLHKKMLASIDQFIAVSKQVKKNLIKKNNINSDKIKVIYNGMDLSNYNNIDSDYLYSEFNISKDNFVIGSVGTICDGKNQELLVDIANEIDLFNIKFIIVGEDFSDKKEYKKKLVKKINKNHLAEKIIITGYREDIPELMNFFDLLIVPSKSEAFGLVAIEAMAAGTPVIANEVDGLKEVIENNNSGILISNNIVNKYQKEILNLYLNEDILNKYRENGLIRVKNKFSLHEMVNLVEKIYKKIV
jgi:glycosyltransferase involved in cell wall biosynthesis